MTCVLNCTAVVFALLTMLFAAGDALATPSCVPVGNPIASENLKAGNPQSEWDLNPVNNGAAQVQGFTTPISVNRGDTVSFKIRIQAPQYPAAYTIDIYRIGYYGGAGARKVKTITGSQASPQPACNYDVTTGLVDCGNWSVTATWNGIETNGQAVPSGIYIAKLSSPGLGASHMIFVLRDDSGCSDLLFQTADTTWQAYNIFTDLSNQNGTPKRISLYTNDDWTQTQPAQPPLPPDSDIPRRGYKVSYNRPFYIRDPDLNGGQHSSFFNAEYPMVRWLEANGYNVSYFMGMDTDRFGAELLEHKVFVSVGHDEYWSAAQRANVEAARAAGVHLAFFAGNEIVWKIRWENDYRTMVCYKETHAGQKIDPSPSWTGTWRDALGGAPYDGNRPENGLLGNLFTTNIIGRERTGTSPNPDHRISVSSEDGQLRLWRFTAARDILPGQSFSLPERTLGFEYDTDVDNGSRPSGVIRLATTDTVPWKLLVDAGSVYQFPAGLPHHITMYRHASGALVFSAGTIQWSWGLDCVHDRGDCSAYAAEIQKFETARQATVNLFLDMGVTPQTPQGDLRTDVVPPDVSLPSSTVVAPTANAVVARGAVTNITGTAADAGGLVAAVEVSDDNGLRWHPATGRASWGSSWTASPSGRAQIRSRAIDDSANQEVPATAITVYVAHPVPGEIQAEDFDRGGEGTGYHDITPGNPGNSQYRAGDGVEITQCPVQTQCNLIVGYIQPGEWLNYTINVAETGVYTFAVRGTYGRGQFRIEIDGVDVSGAMAVPATEDNWIVGTTWKMGVSLTAGRHDLKLVMGQTVGTWVGNFDSIRISRAFTGTPSAIPGSIQAEHFDHGGEGVAYHDTTPGNASVYPSNVRPGTDVDLTACPAGTHCAHIVGYVRQSEWLLYSIHAGATGLYDIIIEGTSGAGGTFHVEIDGVDRTGPMSIPVTGSNWILGSSRATGVSLDAGHHVLRLVVDQDPPTGWIGNFDAIRIIRRPFPVPGVIEAEDYDEGAYFDTTAGNSGSGVHYRVTNVDLTVCPAGSQCNLIIGFVKETEWLQYTINVPAAGSYLLDVQGTNGTPGASFRTEIDGVDRSGPLTIPATGSNWVTGTVTTAPISLTPGDHTLRIYVIEDTNNYLGNFDLLRFRLP
jgi:hypothetical protein